MNEAFCVLPFYRTVIRAHSGMSPCCNIQYFDQATDDTTLADFWQNKKLNNLRANMLQGKKSLECNKCYQQEQLCGNSMRTESLRDHFITAATNLEKLVQGPRYLGKKIANHFELHLGNLCNLKCLTCDPVSSSSFLSENKILKISNDNNRDYQINDTVVSNLIAEVVANRIEVLDLRGGESMLMPSIRKVLDNLPNNHGITILRLQTNCMILDDFWKECFKKFPKIEIMLSIDATHDAINYIRYPADWEVINQNIEYFKSCKNIRLYVNCTISNLNFLLISNVVEWCRDKQIYFHYSLCDDPAYYKCNNLPKELFEQGLEKISRYPQFSNLKLTHDDSLWIEFCKMISTRDKHRKNSIFDILPELKPYWI